MKKNLQSALLAAALALATFAAQAQVSQKPQAPAKAPPPAGVGEKGTFTDPALVRDTMVGVLSAVAMRGCKSFDTAVPYILARPQGQAGRREWKERWVIGGCGKQYPVDILFRESGPGKAADWAILSPAHK
ncbi:MAG: hypothetical protein LBV61_09005 [Burkholderiaceae bacterium]|nr:hypothetical protein [Burkholderiaceae bacterium]